MFPRYKTLGATLEILQLLGAKVTKKNGKIIIDSQNIKLQEIPDKLMRKMRSSVILAGAILGRFKHAIFSYPGDCDIWWIHRTSLR